LPSSGRIRYFRRIMQRSLGDLLSHLTRVTALPERAAARLVDEVLAYFSESVEEFVTRRHRELRAENLQNDAIFERVAAELRTRRFAAPPLSQRQIRRLIYG
jgi:hypothetical protein